MRRSFKTTELLLTLVAMGYLWQESIGLWPYYGKLKPLIMQLPPDVSAYGMAALGSLYAWARSTYKKNTMNRYSAWLSSEWYITLAVIAVLMGLGHLAAIKPLTYVVSLLIIVGNWNLARAYMKSLTKVATQIF